MTTPRADRLKDFPAVLEATRVFLRVPRQGDGQIVYEAVVESREDFLPWLPFAVEEPSPQKSDQWASDQHARFLRGDPFGLLVFDRFTHELIGSSGFANANWAQKWCEIGYWLRTSRQGRGLMTETILFLSDFCLFEWGMDRVEIRSDPKNFRSVRVAERAGFRLEKTLTGDSMTPQGDVRDTAVYVKTR